VMYSLIVTAKMNDIDPQARRAVWAEPNLPALSEGLSARKRRARRRAVGIRAPILVEARPNAR
jgi:hypothetical protein